MLGGFKAMLATFFWVMPISSARIKPCTTQFTMSRHPESSCRTAGASASLEMICGRMV